MSTAVPEKIIERVRKCLKLANKANGATEAEAAAAMAAARKLMDEHNLSMSDVEVEKETKDGARAVEGSKAKAYTPLWEKRLPRVCRHLFNVDFYFDNRYSNGWTGKATCIMFVGVGQDPHIAKEAFTILANIVRKMATARQLSGSDQRDYCLGVVETLVNRAYEIKKASEAQPEMSSCRGLVVTKGALVKQFMDNAGLTKGRAPTARFSHHYLQGAIDGKKVDLGFKKALK